MRKGQKGTKYLVIEDGVQFRTIAKTMTDVGYKMNHATARTKCTFAIRKLFNAFLNEIKNGSSQDNIVLVDKLMNNIEVHNALPELLYAAFNQDLEETERNRK